MVKSKSMFRTNTPLDQPEVFEQRVSLVDEHRNEPKFAWAGHVFTELGESDNGRSNQRKV
jgi:hypothetical protein